MSLIVSNRYKYIFFHLPKNAGVSVSRMLIDQEKFLQLRRIFSFFSRKLFKTKDNFYFSKKNKKLIFFSSHLPCYQFQEIIDDEIFNDYLKFAVIRNPWDRMVSRYFYSKKVNKKFKDFNFEEFVNFDLKKNMHIINQYKYCSDKKNNFCLNAVVKFENLNNDLNKISTKLFDKQDMLKHYNQSEHKQYREYYSQKLKDKIYTYCKKDIDFFEYEF